MKNDNLYKEWTNAMMHSPLMHKMVEQSIEGYEAHHMTTVDKDILLNVLSEVNMALWDSYGDLIYDIIEEQL